MTFEKETEMPIAIGVCIVGLIAGIMIQRAGKHYMATEDTPLYSLIPHDGVLTTVLGDMIIIVSASFLFVFILSSLPTTS